MFSLRSILSNIINSYESTTSNLFNPDTFVESRILNVDVDSNSDKKPNNYYIQNMIENISNDDLLQFRKSLMARDSVTVLQFLEYIFNREHFILENIEKFVFGCVPDLNAFFPSFIVDLTIPYDIKKKKFEYSFSLHSSLPTQHDFWPISAEILEMIVPEKEVDSFLTTTHILLTLRMQNNNISNTTFSSVLMTQNPYTKKWKCFTENNLLLQKFNSSSEFHRNKLFAFYHCNDYKQSQQQTLSQQQKIITNPQVNYNSSSSSGLIPIISSPFNNTYLFSKKSVVTMTGNNTIFISSPQQLLSSSNNDKNNNNPISDLQDIASVIATMSFIQTQQVSSISPTTSEQIDISVTNYTFHLSADCSMSATSFDTNNALPGNINLKVKFIIYSPTKIISLPPIQQQLDIDIV